MSDAIELKQWFTPVGTGKSNGSPRLITRTSRDSVVFTRTRVECGSDDQLSDFELAIISLHALSAELARLRRVEAAAKKIDTFLDGWCSNGCSCASKAKAIHEELAAALRWT